MITHAAPRWPQSLPSLFTTSSVGSEVSRTLVCFRIATVVSHACANHITPSTPRLLKLTQSPPLSRPFTNTAFLKQHICAQYRQHIKSTAANLHRLQQRAHSLWLAPLQLPSCYIRRSAPRPHQLSSGYHGGRLFQCGRPPLPQGEYLTYGM